MKVIVCIDLEGLNDTNLTVDKIYNVDWETFHWYEIPNDKGIPTLYDKWRFIS